MRIACAQFDSRECRRPGYFSRLPILDAVSGERRCQTYRCIQVSGKANSHSGESDDKARFAVKAREVLEKEKKKTGHAKSR